MASRKSMGTPIGRGQGSNARKFKAQTPVLQIDDPENDSPSKVFTGRFGQKEYEISNPREVQFGNVFKLKDKDGNLYAAKPVGLIAQKQFKKEAMQYFHMDPHPNILTIVDIAHVVHLNRDLKLLVMPWATVGNLQQCLSCCTVSKSLRIHLCKQVADGLQHLHSLEPPMIHQNLKPGNIMMFIEEGKLVAKVTDFGIMASGSSGQILASDTVKADSKGKSTPPRPRSANIKAKYWAAPEQRPGVGIRLAKVTKKSDVFSLGLICIWVLGKQEFNDDFAQSFAALKYHAPGIAKRVREYLEPYGWKISKKIVALGKYLGMSVSKYPSGRPELSDLIKVISATVGKRKGKFKFEFKAPTPSSPVSNRDSRRKKHAKLQNSEKQIRFTQFIDTMFNNPRSSVAYKFYTRDAERGDPKAQYNLANCYSKGIGMEKNEKLAVKWYNASAVQGNAEAQNDLGLCYQHGRGVDKDESIAFQWFGKSAAQKYTLGQFNLGMCYEKGIGTEADMAKAAVCYRIAAEQGSFEAMTNLGLCYERGDGVDIDQKKAIQLYMTAAEQGDPMAQFNVALCYQKGIGVDENMEKAFEWYLKAAESGYAQAQCNLGVFFQQGIGVDQDEMMACKWYITSAAQGYAEAQNNLGICYEFGIGVPADAKLAVQWYTEASLQGHPEAQYNLANCYRKGVGVHVDLNNAFQWYNESATKGNHPDAMFQLAICYHEGIGVEIDEKAAIVWCNKAAELEHTEAQYNIAICLAVAHKVEKNEPLVAEYFERAAQGGNVESVFNFGVCCEYGIGVQQDLKAAKQWYEEATKELEEESQVALTRIAERK